MSTDLLDDLARLGTLLERMSSSITAEQIIISRATRSAPSEPDRHSAIRSVSVDDESAVVVAFPGDHTAPRARIRIAAMIALVAAALAGVVWISANRTPDQLPASRTDPLAPSETPDKIDLYPVLDPSDMPIEMPDNKIGGTWANSTEDQGWGGVVGVPAGADGVPTSVIQVSVFPVGFSSTWPAAVPGRRAGVSEGTWEGGTTLLWSVDGAPLTMAGTDPDLMYELIDHVRPVTAATTRGGYELMSPLPGGLVELDVPRHRPAMWFPGIGDVDDSGTLNLYMDGQSPLILIGSGDTDVAAVSIGSYRGFVGSRDGHTDLVFATSTDESVFMSSTVLNRAQLIAVAMKIRFVDEAAWREHYGVDWGGHTTDAPLDGASGPIVITATTSPSSSG